MKSLKPTRYTLRIGKTYRLKHRRTKHEIIFTVTAKNNLHYTCQILACTKPVPETSPPNSISIMYKDLSVYNWGIVEEWKLDEKNLPLYATWGFCCGDFLKKLKEL